MKNKIKLIIAGLILVAIILLIMIVAKKSFANEEMAEHINGWNTKITKTDVKTNDRFEIKTANDEDYIYFSVEIKDKQSEATYGLNASIIRKKLWNEIVGKTVTALVEESSNNIIFTDVEERTLSSNTSYRVIDQLELTHDKTFFRVSLKAGNEAIKITDRNVDIDIEIEPFFVYDYDYTGEEQEFTATAGGNYRIDLWGAQGGNAAYGSASFDGGSGGYSSGSINLKEGDKLYVVVGEAGGSHESADGTTDNSDNKKGYNGGGIGSFWQNNSTAGGGGGATHVATESGLLSSFSEKKDKVLIVAGGGGGAKAHASAPSYSGEGGDGGGVTGIDGTSANTTCYSLGLGGTQTAAGGNSTCSVDGHDYSTGSNQPDLIAGFGQGGNYSSLASNATYSGGGGGYYGGAAGFHAPAGGGSGYIGGVTDGITISGNSSMPHHDRIYTDTNFSRTSVSIGNGYARITGISETTITKKSRDGVDVVLIKENSDLGSPISGVKFRLWGTSNAGDEVDLEVTSVSGEVIFTDIPVGEYQLQETYAPEQYIMDDTVYTVKVN